MRQISVNPCKVVDYYPPAKVLVSKGLAIWNARQYLEITEKGKNEIESGNIVDVQSVDVPGDEAK